MIDCLIDSMTQDVYGHYRVTGTLNERCWRGGLLVGEHISDGTRAAVKVLSIRYTTDSLERWFAKIPFDHPAFARVLEHGRLYSPSTLKGDGGFVVTELLTGEDLDARIDRGPLAVPEAIEIARQTARAFVAAHADGIVHGDLKPANIFFVEQATGLRIKILDLGIGWLVEANQTRCGSTSRRFETAAPEQLINGPFDHRADLYALGAVLYHMLTGCQLFYEPGGSFFHQPIAALTREPPDPRDVVPDLPARLAELVLQLLAKDPAQRPQSMDEVASVLGQLTV